MKFRNLTILGTSHISPKSLKDVEKAIEEEKPTVVALELDRKRLHALIERENGNKEGLKLRHIKKIGVKGFLFSLIGAWIERKLGERVGVAPGTEMLTAYKLARKTGAKIALIDQDIEVTLKNFSKALTWREKGRFITDIVKTAFFKEELPFDLRSVPEKKVIKKLIAQVKERYPSVYRVLIGERNSEMAKTLASIMLDYPEEKVLAIVGAGHEEEIIRMVRNKVI